MASCSHSSSCNILIRKILKTQDFLKKSALFRSQPMCPFESPPPNLNYSPSPLWNADTCEGRIKAYCLNMLNAWNYDENQKFAMDSWKSEIAVREFVKTFFFVREFVKMKSLRSWIRESRPPWGASLMKMGPFRGRASLCLLPIDIFCDRWHHFSLWKKKLLEVLCVTLGFTLFHFI